jgi:hypothetical protein
MQSRTARTKRIGRLVTSTLAILGVVAACVLLTPVIVTSAGCCPGPNCGTGGSGSGSNRGGGEGGCGHIGLVCCEGGCLDASSVCTNPEAGALSRCEHCGSQGEACCTNMSCPDPAAPYCTDVWSGGKYTCQNMPPPGSKPPPKP